MNKSNKIIYWVATAWLSLGMLSTGIVQLMKMDKEVAVITHLGYPLYFLTIIGAWKIAGVIAVLVPKLALVKEWAYAGFIFVMTGAVFSHLAMNDEAIEFFGPVLLILLSIVSWYFRPADKKLFSAK
ncbi:DoxX family protein [Panacibacter sp. DH6]|uniref:DoxX family protein n=1 Tax=Panacibacter microcysteis TaxID=2793269 RepID=A0A931E9T9_9BACT|nr:DoxX family protein [Panacibacter microcysteis]MBG9377809.1 DoxX family protein [Panacibacter microcysteis]